MSDLGEKRAFVSVLFTIFRWWAGYFQRPAYQGTGTPSANERSPRLLFFCVSSVLHAVAIFSLAATPSPKRASAIEVTLVGSPSFAAYGQVALPGRQEENTSPSERKSPPRVCKERVEAKTAEAEAEAATKSTAQSLAQSFPSKTTPPSAMEGGGEGQSTEARRNVQAAVGNHPGGAGVANSGTDEHTLAQYLRLVRERIGRYKKYPFIARKRALEGEVGIRFLLTGAGEAQFLAISKSSGQEILDRAALKAVQDGAPFPRPPADLLAEPLTIELNIVFNLS